MNFENIFWFRKYFGKTAANFTRIANLTKISKQKIFIAKSRLVGKKFIYN